MRVMFVSTDADIGGAERFLSTLGRNWPAGDPTRLVVLMAPGSLSETLETAFDEVRYLGFAPTSRNLVGMVTALRAQVREFRPDVISSHMFHADLITALLPGRVPRTTTIHTQQFGEGVHPLTRAIARVVGLLSFRFAAVIPASDSSAMADFARGIGMRNIVDPIINAAELSPSALFSPASRTLLHLARSHPVKGHLQLFEAFGATATDHPEWTLRVVGPGVTADDAHIGRCVEQAGVGDLVVTGRIVLAGPTSAVAAELADASALVISSTYGEAFPIVGVEAAGAGIPVISTDVGSCAAFVDDDRFLVPPGDSEALARAMGDWFGLSDADRAELSRHARARAEADYAPSIAVDAYRATFSRAIDGD